MPGVVNVLAPLVCLPHIHVEDDGVIRGEHMCILQLLGSYMDKESATYAAFRVILSCLFQELTRSRKFTRIKSLQPKGERENM